MAQRIQLRRDTIENWKKINPILLEGEIGFTTDGSNQYKLGDNIHSWNELPFLGFAGNLVQEPGDSETSVMSQKAITDLINISNVKIQSLKTRIEALENKLK